MLTPGQKLGPYEIDSPLGAGGMGEVYRARDTRLGRDVAVKILPAQFAQDAQRLARFEREAQLLAALNHPHIAHIYGLEETSGTRALVMELVEGPTLADQIEKGLYALEEAVRIARQVAEGLEYAHDRGIIHRDLKPANVKLTADGNVKILDFGLAKALEAEPAATEISHSPTLTAAATQAGIVLGTAAYMSPEQAKGKLTDRRADIWAFGVLLYEMLSGKKLYEADTAQETLAAVLIKEPALDSLPPNLPPRLRGLLRRCLTKDLRARLQAIGEARIILEEITAHPGGAPEETGAARAAAEIPAWQRLLPWSVAGLAIVIAGVALWAPWRTVPRPSQAVRLSAETGVNVPLAAPLFGSEVVLSPDGRRMVLVVRGADNVTRLYLRSLDQMQATPLSGTEGGRDPFFSPDGQWIGFFSIPELKKISVQGGAAVTLCKTGPDRGGSWGEEGTIVFAQVVGQTALFKVAESGGTPQPVASDKNALLAGHFFPQMLPGGKAVLFATGLAPSLEEADIKVYSFASGELKTVFRGGFYPRYVRSGHLVYMHQGTLFAVPFDLKRLEVTGQGVPVVEGVMTNPGLGGAQFSVSETGTLVYAAGSGVAQGLTLHWMDQQGKFTSLRNFPGIPANPRFSPDGKRLAVDIDDGKRRDVFVYDLERDTPTRITFSGERNSDTAWSPDGQRITFASQEKGGEFGLYSIRADGAGDAQLLTQNKNPQLSSSWRPDGRVLAFAQLNTETGSDIMTLTLQGNEKSGWNAGQPEPFLITPANESAPRFSLDGRWLAYQSDESGTMEVYVRPFPGPGGRWQISTGGGGGPRWARNGKDLFYRTPPPDQKIMVVSYSASGDAFHADKPRPWAPGQASIPGPPSGWDLHPDGRRIATAIVPLAAPGVQPLNKISFVFNFFDELRRVAPTKK